MCYLCYDLSEDITRGVEMVKDNQLQAVGMILDD